MDALGGTWACLKGPADNPLRNPLGAIDPNTAPVQARGGGVAPVVANPPSLQTTVTVRGFPYGETHDRVKKFSVMGDPLSISRAVVTAYGYTEEFRVGFEVEDVIHDMTSLKELALFGALPSVITVKFTAPMNATCKGRFRAGRSMDAVRAASKASSLGKNENIILTCTEASLMHALAKKYMALDEHFCFVTITKQKVEKVLHAWEKFKAQKSLVRATVTHAMFDRALGRYLAQARARKRLARE